MPKNSILKGVAGYLLGLTSITLRFNLLFQILVSVTDSCKVGPMDENRAKISDEVFVPKKKSPKKVEIRHTLL